MAGYSRDVIWDFAARFGPEDPITKAIEKARTVPGFAEEIHRVELEIGGLEGAFLYPPRAELEKLKAEHRDLVVEALKEDAPGAESDALDAEGGAVLAVELVERAVQLRRASERAGARRVGKLRLSRDPDLPGLTQWYAGQILRWYKRGKPEGLWLDDDDGRLRWGTAITPVSLNREQPGAGFASDREQPGAGSAPACSHLRLPRI